MGTEKQDSDEKQAPGCHAAATERTGIATDTDAMRRFCTDLWIAGEIEALQLVRTKAAIRIAGSVYACELCSNTIARAFETTCGNHRKRS